MSPDETIEKMIRNYPTIFPNRTCALHHLFCVIGNGYEWENGEIVTIFDDESERDDPLRTWIDNALENDTGTLSDETKARWEWENRYLKKKLKQISDNAHLLAQIPGPLIGPQYPPSSHAMMLTMPEDVTPEWKEAAIEHAVELKDNPRSVWHHELVSHMEKWALE